MFIGSTANVPCPAVPWGPREIVSQVALCDLRENSSRWVKMPLKKLLTRPFLPGRIRDSRQERCAFSFRNSKRCGNELEGTCRDGHFLSQQRKQCRLRNRTLNLTMGQPSIGRHSQRPQGQNKSNTKWLLTSSSFRPAGEIRKTKSKEILRA